MWNLCLHLEQRKRISPFRCSTIKALQPGHRTLTIFIALVPPGAPRGLADRKPS